MADPKKVAAFNRQSKPVGPAEKKAFILAYVKNGETIAAALRALGTSRQLYEYYRRTDATFKEHVDAEFAKRQHGIIRSEGKGVPPFPDFSEKYLKARLFRHQLQWLDLLEGREPRDLHPNQIYTKGEPRMILVNTPPDHAKSTTITVNYVTWRICEDPNIRVLIVSKTRDMAKKFLRAIKDRLVGTPYLELQKDFAPAGGFEANSAGWTQDAIYVSGDIRDSGEKDPTVQALGIGGHIYGSRADLIILDDCIDDTNVAGYEKQIDWLQNMVDSRLEPLAGLLLMVGTRVAPIDLYSEVMKPVYWSEGESPWTYLTQPAVLEYAERPEEWVTLWPKSNMPPVSQKAREAVSVDADGLWPRWDGPALSKVRARRSPRNWSMIYMQEQVADDSIFKAEDVVGCLNGMRATGPMRSGAVGHRKHGMDGLYVVAGLDPAMAGCTAAVVIGLDRTDNKRYILDLHNQAAMRPDEIRNVIKSWTDKYRIQEWRIEKNAFQKMLTQDREVREYLANRGCLLKEHFTGNNKWDTEFGVASMSMLFEGWQDKRNLIELPSREKSEACKQLIEQLVTWEPEQPGTKSKRKTDLVMALWFAEIRCRELVNVDWGGFHLSNNFLSARDREKQVTLDLDMMLQAGMPGF
jgi:hypothetical protein